MRYYFCIKKDNSINKDFILRNLTSKQLKYTIRDYIYALNNGRINKKEIPLLSTSLIYDIRNGRAHKKYNIFKIFNNETELNTFLKKNGIDIKDNNKVKLSNIMKYKPSNKILLSDFYKNYDKKLNYDDNDDNDDNDENIYIGEGFINKNNSSKINKKHLKNLLD